MVAAVISMLLIVRLSVGSGAARLSLSSLITVALSRPLPGSSFSSASPSQLGFCLAPSSAC